MGRLTNKKNNKKIHENSKDSYDERLKLFKKRIGRNILTMRKISGLTGEEFAISIGISRTHLYHIERGDAYNFVFDALYHLNNKISLSSFFKEDLSENFNENIDNFLKDNNINM